MNKAKKPIFKRWWFWLIVVVIFIIAVSGGGKGNENEPASISKPTPSPISEPTPSPEPTPGIPWISEGMYKVGTDIDAGEYFVQAAGYCYVEVASNSTGTLDSIVTNENISTFMFITVKDGQYLTVSDGKFVSASEAPVPGAVDGVYGEGMYRVGTDLPPGEYLIAANSGYMAYVEISKDSSGSLYSIISNDNFEGEKYLTVSDGQYLTISGGVIHANQ